MKALKTTLWITALCLSLCACSVKKDLDNMMETTEEMNDTTKDMNNTTKDMSKTTTEMNDTTKEMKTSTEHMRDRMEDAFHGLREGLGEEKMQLHFEKMMEAGKTGEKVDHALIFFASMDFQHWQGDHEDTKVKRDQLIYKNIEYFFSKINDLVDDKYPVATPILSAKKRNNWKSLGALAVAMSKIHPDQVTLSKELNFLPMSFYDVLALGLSQKEKYENDEDVASWVEKVLEKEDVAIYLMQLRHNFLKGVILGEMTDFEEGWFDGMFNKVGFALIDTTIDNFEKFNKAKLKKWIELLWKTRRTQELLELLGQPLQFNKILNSSFSRVNFLDFINFENGIEKVPHPLNKNAPPLLEFRYLSTESFSDVSLDYLSSELQDVDVQTNFFLRFFDLQTYGN